MLNFKQISPKKKKLELLKKFFNNAIRIVKLKNTLITKDQCITESISNKASTGILIENQILTLIKSEEKFLTTDELFSYLSGNSKNQVFDLKKIHFSLEKLEKERKIYEYRIPKTELSLWGQAYWLDKNMIPSEKYIYNKNLKDYLRNYRVETNLI